MGVTNFQIVFDNPSGEYYPGTNVTGKLQFYLDKPMKIRAIVIKFAGEARTSWNETETRHGHNPNTGRVENHHTTVKYTATEEYFSNKYNLAGSSSSETVLPPGNHEYPFTTILPPMLPSSFESKYGNIRYTVKATIDRPWKFDQHLERAFTVTSPLDLNYNLRAKEPVKLEVEKYFCCFWCKSGPLTMVINIPFSGFIPGQNIPVTLEIDNASSVRVENVVLKLEKLLVWKARQPRMKERNERMEIVRLTLDAVEARRSRSYTHQIAVPTLLPYNLDQCTIIDYSYLLEVTADVSGCHRNLTGEVPIFLGTVPLYQVPLSPPPAANDQVPSAPPLMNGHPAPAGFIGNPSWIN